MTLTRIIELINESGVDQKLKDMVISYVQLAHQIGFEEGVKHTTEMQRKVFEVMGQL